MCPFFFSQKFCITPFINSLPPNVTVGSWVYSQPDFVMLQSRTIRRCQEKRPSLHMDDWQWTIAECWRGENNAFQLFKFQALTLHLCPSAKPHFFFRVNQEPRISLWKIYDFKTSTPCSAKTFLRRFLQLLTLMISRLSFLNTLRRRSAPSEQFSSSKPNCFLWCLFHWRSLTDLWPCHWWLCLENN